MITGARSQSSMPTLVNTVRGPVDRIRALPVRRSQKKYKKLFRLRLFEHGIYDYIAIKAGVVPFHSCSNLHSLDQARGCGKSLSWRQIFGSPLSPMSFRSNIGKLSLTIIQRSPIPSYELLCYAGIGIRDDSNGMKHVAYSRPQWRGQKLCLWNMQPPHAGVGGSYSTQCF